MAKLKILINAYACCPNKGSEPGMAWNFVAYLSQFCELHVLTESEFENQNITGLQSLSNPQNVHFYFIPVGSTENDSIKIRAKCWNQGTWSFYYYYAKWQEKALSEAREIIRNNKIDIIHQLNMVGFREPGLLYVLNEELKNAGQKTIPLIWGPTAGFGSMPVNFLIGSPPLLLIKNMVKNFLNVVELKWHPRVLRMISSASEIISATPDMRKGFKEYHDRDTVLISETGTYLNKFNTQIQCREANSCFKILWVGRFIFTKQLELAMRIISRVSAQISHLEFHIIGTGISDKETLKMKEKSQQYNIDHICYWHGQIPNFEVQRIMRSCDLFLFTSIFEATSTVILEAISNNLPIVCFDICGFGPIVDESIGRKIRCSNPHDAVEDFSHVILSLINDKSQLCLMSRNCEDKKKQLSWDYKIGKILEIYNRMIN